MKHLRDEKAFPQSRRQSVLPVPTLETIVERGDKNAIFEIILEDIGGFGKYQVLILLLASVSSIVSACNHLSPIFLAFSPSFECTPSESNGTSYISQSPSNDTSISSLFANDPACFDSSGMDCQTFSYDGTVMARSIVTHFNLVCARLPLLPLVSSTYMAGVMLTTIFSGFFSDRLGRRTIVLTLTAIHVIATFATCFATKSYLAFILARFFVGGTTHGTWVALFVITTEISTKSRRGLAGFVMNLGWNVGAIILAAVAYLSRDWVTMQLAFSGISLLTISYFFVIPESPRWLMERGKFEEAEVVLRKIAKYNGINVEFGHGASRFEGNMKALKLSSDVTEREHLTFRDTFQGVSHFCTYPIFRKRIALFLLPWFFVGMASYGIHFSVKLVDFDIFIMSVIKEIVIIISIACLLPVYTKFKRTHVLPIFFLLGGILGILFLAFPVRFLLIRVGLLVLTQGLIVADFCLLDTFTPEAFSTDTRNFVLALLDGVSKAGTLIAPFIVDLGGYWYVSAPPAIFGILMILASIWIKFLLPETKGTPLKQSIADLAT